MNISLIFEKFHQSFGLMGLRMPVCIQCVAVCCRVLPCVAVCCCVLPCVAVCCRVLPCVAVCCRVLPCVAVCGCVLHCSVLYQMTVALTCCCSVSQCIVAVCCSVTAHHEPYASKSAGGDFSQVKKKQKFPRNRKFGNFSQVSSPLNMQYEKTTA